MYSKDNKVGQVLSLMQKAFQTANWEESLDFKKAVLLLSLCKDEHVKGIVVFKSKNSNELGAMIGTEQYEQIVHSYGELVKFFPTGNFAGWENEDLKKITALYEKANLFKNDEDLNLILSEVLNLYAQMIKKDKESSLVLNNHGDKLFLSDGNRDKFGELAIFHSEIEKKNGEKENKWKIISQIPFVPFFEIYNKNKPKKVESSFFKSIFKNMET